MQFLGFRKFTTTLPVPAFGSSYFFLDFFSVFATLQGREEALGHSVVPAVTLSAHATSDAPSFHGLSVVLAGVRTPPIRMVNQPAAWATLGKCHIQRRQGEMAIHALAGRPANDPPRKHIENDGEVKPALARALSVNIDLPALPKGYSPLKQLGGLGLGTAYLC